MGLCSSKGGDQLHRTVGLVVSALVLQLGITMFGRSSTSMSLHEGEKGEALTSS